MVFDVQTTINRRLILFLEKLGISRNEFASTLATSSRNVYNYLDEGRAPSVDFLQRVLTRYPSLNPAWLLMGEGDMVRRNDDALRIRLEAVDRENRLLRQQLGEKDVQIGKLIDIVMNGKGES